MGRKGGARWYLRQLKQGGERIVAPSPLSLRTDAAGRRHVCCGSVSSQGAQKEEEEETVHVRLQRADIEIQ